MKRIDSEMRFVACLLLFIYPVVTTGNGNQSGEGQSRISNVWAESKPLSPVGDQKIFDKVTGIKFNSPKGVTVTHTDWGYCPIDKPSVEPPQELSWYVHTRSFEKGDFKNRTFQFIQNIAASDGEDGGTNGKGALIKKFETASKAFQPSAPPITTDYNLSVNWNTFAVV